MLRNQRGIILITAYLVVVILLVLGSAFMARSISEMRIAERERDSIRAFHIAEGGLEQAIYDLKKDFENYSSPSWDDGNINNVYAGPNTASFYSLYSQIPLGGGNYKVELKNVAGKDNEIWIKSTGTFDSLSRTIQARIKIENSWLSKIPAAVYSNGVVKAMKFDKRDDAYIDGGSMPGIYSTDEVKTKKKGEGRIDGNPPILEDQEVPEGLQDGIWDAFDINALRKRAIDDGTYFSGDEYNKKGKYTLPVEEGETDGVFFFDTKDGEVLDDDAIDRKNEAKIELRGTTTEMSGIIVVIGDLTIKDTKDYDFLFDGVIIVLDDLKMHDNRHGRRDGTNDSDILIKGAVLSDDIVYEGKKHKKPKKPKKRKKKPSIDIKNATIDYDPGAITKAASYASSYWTITPESWQEID